MQNIPCLSRNTLVRRSDAPSTLLSSAYRAKGEGKSNFGAALGIARMCTFKDEGCDGVSRQGNDVGATAKCWLEATSSSVSSTAVEPADVQPALAPAEGRGNTSYLLLSTLCGFLARRIAILAISRQAANQNAAEAVNCVVCSESAQTAST